MNKAQANCAASLRDQRLDVHLGIIDADEWNRRLAAGVERFGPLGLEPIAAGPALAGEPDRISLLVSLDECIADGIGKCFAEEHVRGCKFWTSA